MAKPSELKQIRVLLGLSQTEMGKLLGVQAQSAYARWEAEPEKPAARAALEKAILIFEERKKTKWETVPAMLAEAEPTYRVAGTLPSHIEQAYITLCEILEGAKATPADVDRKVFARILGKAAREFALAPNPEMARTEVVRDAELFLEILK